MQLQIAQSSKRDSTQMRSIALLTMIFLPGTYVAVRPNTFFRPLSSPSKLMTPLEQSFFAMPLFKWDADPTKKERIYSDKFWIYWVVTASLTLAVIVVWVLFSCRSRIRRRRTRRAEYGKSGLLGIFRRAGNRRDEERKRNEKGSSTVSGSMV